MNKNNKGAINNVGILIWSSHRKFKNTLKTFKLEIKMSISAFCSYYHTAIKPMTWACMTASGTDSLIFIDGVTHDGSQQNELSLKSAETFCLLIYWEMHPINLGGTSS